MANPAHAQRIGDGPPTSLATDYAIALVALWMIGGVYIDAWAHGHEPVETFFTPYHGFFYASLIGAGAIIATTMVANRLRGYRGMDMIPRAYRWSFLAAATFVAAGLGDLLWHTFMGVEAGVDVLLSPTHQALGISMFIFGAGSVRSVVERRSLRAVDQFPAIIALAAWLEILHFGTAYGFDPGADRPYGVAPIVGFSPDALTFTVLDYYKHAIGMLTVLLQSALTASFAILIIARLRPFFGAATALFFLGNVMMAAAYTNDTPLLAKTIASSLAAGIVADGMLAIWKATPARTLAFFAYAALVPLVYLGTYEIGTAVTTGLWWDANMTFGALLWSALIGSCIAFLASRPRAEQDRT